MLHVGFAQFRPLRYDVAQNSATVINITRGLRADLLVLPELANSGYLYESAQQLEPFAEPASGQGPFLRALQGVAESIGGVVVTGFAEHGAGGLYNSAAAVGPHGVLAVYRKTHLFDREKELFLPGDTGFVTFQHQGVAIGLMICFDWAFPEAARTLALRGASVIAHPSNLVLGHCQRAMLTRSLENGVFSITANRYGEEELEQRLLGFTGASQVVGPKGELLLQAPSSGDSVQVCTVEPADAQHKLITPRNHLLNDRRPEFYS